MGNNLDPKNSTILSDTHENLDYAPAVNADKIEKHFDVIVDASDKITAKLEIKEINLVHCVDGIICLRDN